MLSRLLNRKIYVEFIDQNNKKLFACTKLSFDQIPESFDTPTTMHIKNEDWSVVSAEPSNLAEIKKSKKLKLFLRKIEFMNPNNILFTLPTLCDCLPDKEEIKDRSAINFTILEDDWRQIEFISSSKKAIIESEFIEIKKIYRDQVVPDVAIQAFKELYLRKKINTPLESNLLSIENISEVINVKPEFNLAFQGDSAVLKNGFNFRLSESVVYGIAAPGEKVRYLAVKFQNTENFYKKDLLILKTLCERYALLLVHWSAMCYIIGE